MFNSGFKGIRAVDGSGIVTLKDVEVQQTSLQPKITSWAYTNGAYVPYPDTAIVGGETIVIYGSGFQNGANVYIGSTAIKSTQLDQNRITFTAPSQSAGSYVLYVINPNGNAAVYAPGIYYNSYPVWNTTSYANTFVTSTSSVSFNLNATDSANLTFTLQSGSLPTGLTLYSSGLISGNTTVANTTVYTFTAVATDSFNQAAQASIIYTITYLISDPYFNQTTLLLNGETNTNTYIQDTSNNNFALTVTGAANPNRFSPLWGAGYYGNSFDGSAYITTPYNSAFQVSGDMTIEFWVNFSATFTNAGLFMFDGFSGYGITIDTSRWVVSWLGVNIIVGTTGASIPSPSVWTHVALVRNSGTVRLYINGVQLSSAAGAAVTVVTGTFDIGRSNDGTAYQTTGYISNFRYVSGTCLYPSGTTFTPPTTPLTAIANTTLLTCQSANFVDNSTNAFTLTPTGTVKVVSNQPFATVPSTATITTNNAGYYSGYFDGSTGYIPIAQAFNQATTTTPFTWELWFFTNVVNATNGTLLSSYFNGGANHILYNLYISSAGVYNFRYYTGSAWVGTNSTTTYTPAAWNHIAAVYNGTVCTLYLNGTSVGSVTTSWIGTNGASQTNIGASYDNTMAFAGYISNVRFVNGTAVYTANFTPPTSPLTAITNTALLTCQNSTYIDNSTNSFAITPTGKTQPSTYQPFTAVTTSTAVTPANYGAGLFDGSTGYLTVPANSAFTLGTNNHTIEFWMYLAGAQGPYATQWYYSSGVTQQATNNYYFQAGSAGGGAFSLLLGSGGAWGVNINAGSTPYTQALNNWTHVAITRSGSTFRLFANGIQVGSATYSGSISAQGGGMLIGTDGSNYATGYISNFRIVNGTALYTSNFIPPTTPLTAIANTALLTLQNKNGANNNTFYDDSSNNFALTKTGTVAQGSFTPFAPAYSNYFGGSTNALTVANQPISTTANTFTVEAWIYPTATPTGTIPAVVGDNGSNYSNWSFGPTSSNTLQFYWYTTTGVTATGNTTILLNTWTHIAVSVNSGAISLYVNGIAQTITGTSTLSNRGTAGSTLAIGSFFSGSYAFTGYISNLRVVAGTALYTTNFTPPTSPLTAITNTSLLTCQSNRFVDNSTNNFSITVTGTVQVQAFSPFAPGVSYSSANNGGSMYFPATGNYLSYVNSMFNISSGTLQWTFETWVYPTNTNANFFAIGNGGVYGNSMVCGWNSNNFNFGQSNGGSAPVSVVSTSGTYYPYAWYHYAISKDSSGNIRLFINGVQVNTQNYTSTVASGTTAVINGLYDNNGLGNSGGQWYLSGLRLVIGQALYTSAFTPPTAPLTPTANATLLLLGTNTGIQDATGKNDIITYGSAKTQANTVKYGTGALYFDGSTGYCTIPTSTNQNFTLRTGNFTIELWAYIATSSLTADFLDFRATTTNGIYPRLLLNSGALNYYVNGSTVITGSSPSISTWHHIALVRNSGTTTLYLDGTATGSAYTDSNSYLVGSVVAIGSSSYTLGSNYFNGYIDDLRITNGVARYTANFTPPTTADLLQ